MRFLKERNPTLHPRYQHIAALYRQHGEANRVRWDYAFFQMAVETNYLTFRRGDGKPGDVKPAQNNFAGIGTTGGGVPGDSFPDVSSGVLAQIQHLMVYSGERIAAPVAPRTRDKQDDIIKDLSRLHRRVTFQDLAGRSAADRRYGRTLQLTAARFYDGFCKGGDDEEDHDRAPAAGDVAASRSGGGRIAGLDATLALTPSASAASALPAPIPVRPVPPPAARVRAGACKVFTASYGGDKAVLIRADVGGETHYTAVQVLPGFEVSLTRSYISEHAKGGEAIGEFATRRDALVKAFELCPSALGTASGR
jgi:hypothetical protein